MGATAAVVGASGYAGGELVRLLAGHPQLTVGPLAAGEAAGRPLAAVHPHLAGLGEHTLTTADDPSVADADVVFLAVPHGASAAIAAHLPERCTVIDVGADFRLRDAAAWQRWYGGDHSGTWPYGLPELPDGRGGKGRDHLAGASRIANPGCYATAIALALAPLLASGLAEPEDLVVVAASGTSGAGRAAKPHLLGTEVMGSLSPYKVGGTHQHLAELHQSLGDAAGGPVTLSFTPVLAPMPRGILATCTARTRATEADLRAALQDAYDGEPLVAVLREGQWPSTAATLGSGSAHLQVAADVDAGRVVVVAAIDNLGKGAAAQALQNANIALGLPETAGVPVLGVAP